MNCPSCRQLMEERSDYEGVPYHECEACGGRFNRCPMCNQVATRTDTSSGPAWICGTCRHRRSIDPEFERIERLAEC